MKFTKLSGRGRKSILATCAISVLSILGWVTPANAVPIRYNFSATGSFVLNNIGYQNELVTFSLLGDTSNTFVTTPGQFPGAPVDSGLLINRGVATVTVRGITDTLSTTNNDAGGTAMIFAPSGISAVDGENIDPEFLGVPVISILGDDGVWLLPIVDSRFSGYDLASTFGPITGRSGVNTWLDGSFNPTAIGGNTGFFWLNSSVSNATFWSVADTDTRSVPEPGSLALLGIGLAGLVASRRRRRN